jgi:hypothetical protein
MASHDPKDRSAIARIAVLTVENEEIERDERHIARGATRTDAPAHPIEVARSARVRDQFTVEDDAPTKPRETLKLRDIRGHVTAGTRPDRDRLIDVNEATPTVEFRFEHPLGRFGRRAGARQHRRKHPQPHSSNSAAIWNAVRSVIPGPYEIMDDQPGC